MRMHAIAAFSVMLVGCLLHVLSSHAQDASTFDAKNLSFENIPTELGFDFLQDREGFFWIASTAGVYRYDGYKFKKYPELPSAVAVYQDQSGRIWFMSGDRLTVYDKRSETVRAYTADPDDIHALPGGFTYNYNQSAAEDRRGHLWFGTTKGLCRFDRSTRTFERFMAEDADSGFYDNNIFAMLAARDGLLWVGTQLGLHAFDPDACRVISRYPRADSDPAGLHGGPISALWEDEHGILWVGTASHGLNRFDPKSETFTHYYHDGDDPATVNDNDIRTLFMTPDTPDLLWIGTYNGGLNLLEPATGRVISYGYDEKTAKQGGINGNILLRIRQSDSGAIWLLTTKGFNRLDAGARPFVSYTYQPNHPKSLGQGEITCSGDFDRAGNLWVLLLNGGLSRIDVQSGQVSHFLGTPDEPLKATTGASWMVEDGSFWFADQNKGLVQFDPVTEQIVKEVPADTSGNLYLGLVDATNPDLLWAGSHAKGLFKFNRRTGVSGYLPVDNADPVRISVPLACPMYQDEAGYIWVDEVGGGLSKFDPRTEEVVANYRHDPDDQSSPASNIPQDVYVDSRGRWWVGHLEFGPDLFDPETGIFDRFADRYGRPWPAGSSTVMLEDVQGNLWVAGFGNGTITRFTPDTGETRVFTEQDGVTPSLACGGGLAHRAGDGRFWFFGLAGLTAFYPEQVQDNTFLPPVHITKLAQAGQPLQLGMSAELASEIRLAWDANFFEFEMAALNYRRPEQNNYRYKLDGLDDDWFESGKNRQGRYAGLQEGMYILKVQGSNNDGVWSDKTAVLNVSIGPHIVEGTQVFSLSDIKRGQPVDLKYDENTLMFEAVPLDYTIIEKQNVCYLLDGYDSDWICVSSSRYIPYKKVREGSYTFRVKNTGTGERHALRITIHPPFYRSWWFLSLLGAFIVGWVSFIYSQQISRLKAQSEAKLLGKEMELAREIQTAILPKRIEHDDLEIEATMITADEVGGDFYDILYSEAGPLWIAIGDVSGHGVTPGLIMMMAQTVHTTIATHYIHSPREVVCTLNKVLFRNMQDRLGKDHFMTFTTLKYQGRGTFEHAGAHLSMVVYRKQTQCCELVRTPGTFLNFIEDISESTVNSSFTLEIGDILVLYSDGLTEAENPDGELFDIQRFQDVVKSHAGKETVALRDAVMQDVLNWCRNRLEDDMSLVVVRRIK